MFLVSKGFGNQNLIDGRNMSVSVFGVAGHNFLANLQILVYTTSLLYDQKCKSVTFFTLRRRFVVRLKRFYFTNNSFYCWFVVRNPNLHHICCLTLNSLPGVRRTILCRFGAIQGSFAVLVVDFYSCRFNKPKPTSQTQKYSHTNTHFWLLQ